MLIRPLIRFKLLLGIRVLMAYSRNSIILLWVCIELNILSFLPVLGASDNKSLENRIKYFFSVCYYCTKLVYIPSNKSP